MRSPWRASVVGVCVMAWGLAPAAAQQVEQRASVALAPAQMEEFLLRANIVKTEGVDVGINNTRRATLSDGVFTHAAQIQTVDRTWTKFEPPGQPPEFNFIDSYRFNIGAYRLSLLLGLDNVPMSVERSYQGRRAAVTWWIDDVMMDDGTRVKKQVRSPDTERTAMQIHVMRVFDELIANRDRNLGNVLWTSDWKLWMIDHTRSFRLDNRLRKPELLERIERSLWARLRALTRESVTNVVGRSLTRYEVDAMLDRRDAIVKLFEARIAERGDAAVVYVMRP